MAEEKLTAKQQAFVQEYLIDLNATQAAIRAGYSARTAGQIGERLLRKVEIQKAVQEAQEKRSSKTARTALDVLRDIQETAKEARDLGDLKTALKGYELEGKHLGMFRDKLELTGRDGGPIAIAPPDPATALAALLKGIDEREG